MASWGKEDFLLSDAEFDSLFTDHESEFDAVDGNIYIQNKPSSAEHRCDECYVMHYKLQQRINWTMREFFARIQVAARRRSENFLTFGRLISRRGWHLSTNKQDQRKIQYFLSIISLNLSIYILIMYESIEQKDIHSFLYKYHYIK